MTSMYIGICWKELFQLIIRVQDYQNDTLIERYPLHSSNFGSRNTVNSRPFLGRFTEIQPQNVDYESLKLAFSKETVQDVLNLSIQQNSNWNSIQHSLEIHFKNGCSLKIHFNHKTHKRRFVKF
jgi:hypothetical protein